MCKLSSLLSEDRFLLMGWDYKSLVTRCVDEVKLRHMIGEAIDLRCLGLLMYLIHVTPSAPWWSNPKVPVDIARLGPVGEVSAPVTSAPTQAEQPSVKKRRVGCVKLPPSAC